MAFVIGLVAATARAISGGDDGSNPGYNGSGQNYNNNRVYNNGRAASAVGRRSDRRTDRIATRYQDVSTVMSLVSSSSRSRSAAPGPTQPAPPYMNYGEGPGPRGAYYGEPHMNYGEPCMNYGEGPAPRVAYYASEPQGAGAYYRDMPAGAPEGQRWMDEQRYNRPVSQRGRGLEGAGSSATEPPPYEHDHRPHKS
ncbi:hypothetical protein HDV63DRAFT_82466 [Trichoderma sp. SZMC 28014]